MVWADSQKLERLLQNLIYNAVDFTPMDGAITLSLYTAGPNACIEILDTGCGIPAANLQKIFERNYTTRADSGGQGLGLYIVSCIAREHRGSVSVRSKEGRGTAFTVMIPRIT